MNGDILSFGQVISDVFGSLKTEDAVNSINIYDEWKRILSRIKSSSNPNEGANMAGHSRVVDLKNGILFVEADHPGWISLIQMHKKYILTGLKMKFPRIEFKTLAFRLKSQENSQPKNECDSVFRKMEMQMEEEENINRRYGVSEAKNSAEKERKELPPELKVLFDDLKKSMLTNVEK
ncbi:DUF721 domain-containing protein [Treponema sp.]|uniref:DUF721 domain-containing protein n=1 Tax=Treponema sp. TaxID=166 RepID=UPI003EFF9C8F